MNIPECYDPAFQEEQRQAEWDKFAEQLPTCAVCRRKVMPGERYHVAHCLAVCHNCKEELDESENIVEME